MTDLLYFGCRGAAGHYWWQPSGQTVPFAERPRLLVDGVFAPRYADGSEAPQGICGIYRIGSATLVAYWDQSVDKRPGSNSAFWFGRMSASFNCVVEEAEREFPWVFERQSFELRPSLVRDV